MAVLLCLVIAGCGDDTGPQPIAERGEPKIEAPRGKPGRALAVRDLIEGSGTTAEPGDILTVKYAAVGYDGSFYTTSWGEKKLFKFTLGAGNRLVTPGWEVGLPGMRVGGRRELTIPPALQYDGSAPSDAETLIYVIDLYGIHR